MVYCIEYPDRKTVRHICSSPPVISTPDVHSVLGPAAPPELSESSSDLKTQSQHIDAETRQQQRRTLSEEDDEDEEDYEASQGVSLVDTSGNPDSGGGGGGQAGLYGLGMQRSGMLHQVAEER